MFLLTLARDENQTLDLVLMSVPKMEVRERIRDLDRLYEIFASHKRIITTAQMLDFPERFTDDPELVALCHHARNDQMIMDGDAPLQMSNGKIVVNRGRVGMAVRRWIMFVITVFYIVLFR